MSVALATISAAHVQQADDPLVLTEIYHSQVNLAIWQRTLDETVRAYGEILVQQRPDLQIRRVVAVEQTAEGLMTELPEHPLKPYFLADIQQLAEMYADLFELQRVGLRLSALGASMCPRFHTDQLACRLVCTYLGPGSQWLAEAYVDRNKLGAGAKDLPDEASGIYTAKQGIQNLLAGEVALLKGDGWQGGLVNGIVHRSPMLASGKKRLLLTLDFAN